MDYLKEADKYEAKAEAQFYDYQDSGSPTTLRSYERNRDIARAFRLAASVTLIERELSALKIGIMHINTDAEPQKVVMQLKELQRSINK